MVQRPRIGTSQTGWMLDVHFVILGAIIGTAGMLAYIRDTLRGSTQPNRVTWLMWALAPLLAFAAEVQAGVGLRSLMTFVVGFGPLAIFVASFWAPGSQWRIGAFDVTCGVLSAIGLLVWLLSGRGALAVAMSITADALAAAPTLYKSFSAPQTETASAYFTAAANAAITLLTVKTFSIPEAAFPLYILVLASIETALIAGRVGPRLVTWTNRRQA